MMSCFSYLHACILLFCMFFYVHMHGFFGFLFFIYLSICMHDFFACCFVVVCIVLFRFFFFFLFCFFACIVFFVRCGHLFCLFVSFYCCCCCFALFSFDVAIQFFYLGACWIPALKRTGKNLIKIMKTPHSNKNFS